MRARRGGAGAVVVAAVALGLVGCSGDGGDGAARATTSTAEPSTTAAAPPGGYEPTFAARPCRPPAPDDPRVVCGDLTVPADREAPGDGDVVLPVAIVRSASPDPAPDPIVFVSGGPGDAALSVAGFALEVDLGGDRDVIVYDQRGTGAASPSLDCPEVDVAAAEALASADPVEVESARREAALAACRDRLAGEGIDVDDYDTGSQAADLADLRVALGIDDWNVWALSYGATTALELIRSRPEGVRSLYLDAGVPVDEPRGGDDLAVVVYGALEAFFAACAADRPCAAAYPTLEQDWRDLVADWDAAPFEVVARGPDGQERSFRITGADLVDGLHQALYDSSLIPLLPSLVAPLAERGDAATAIVAPLVEQFLGAPVADGVNQSVLCADRVRLEEGAAEQPVPDPMVVAVAADDFVSSCESWGAEPLPASFNEPVSSDVPSLVVVGSLDPIQPPPVARRMAATLSRSAVVELPGIGHGAVFGSPCGAELLRSFVASADPSAVDTSCVDALGPPEWALP